MPEAVAFWNLLGIPHIPDLPLLAQEGQGQFFSKIHAFRESLQIHRHILCKQSSVVALGLVVPCQRLRTLVRNLQGSIPAGHRQTDFLPRRSQRDLNGLTGGNTERDCVPCVIAIADVSGCTADWFTASHAVLRRDFLRIAVGQYISDRRCVRCLLIRLNCFRWHIVLYILHVNPGIGRHCTPHQQKRQGNDSGNQHSPLHFHFSVCADTGFTLQFFCPGQMLHADATQSCQQFQIRHLSSSLSSCLLSFPRVR